MAYWLLKSEPLTFSIEALKQSPNQTTAWEGVRNYQARNFLRDDFKVNDQAFFYHSNTEVPGIVGIVDVVKAAYPDRFAFDPKSEYFDEKSSADNPRWFVVDVKLKQIFPRVISLSELKENPKLVNMPLVRRGNRLSVLPVTQEEWHAIIKMV